MHLCATKSAYRTAVGSVVAERALRWLGLISMETKHQQQQQLSVMPSGI